MQPNSEQKNKMPNANTRYLIAGHLDYVRQQLKYQHPEAALQLSNCIHKIAPQHIFTKTTDHNDQQMSLPGIVTFLMHSHAEVSEISKDADIQLRAVIQTLAATITDPGNREGSPTLQ